jgi:UDPglucose 6-dehydrogenase
MKVTVIGSGYVGLVAGACLAETGNEVVCADVNQEKVRRLTQNDIPIYEPGLEPMVERNQAEGRLRFTTDLRQAVEHGRVIFIAVGTPPDGDGNADLKQVLGVAQSIGKFMNEPKIVVTKSTVPVGTAERVRTAIRAETTQSFELCSNPEFLKEGAAIEDFMKPDRVVLGVDSQVARDTMEALYAPFVRTGNPILFMDIASAEVTKYAANAMLATRISFMNQIADFCERVGADVSLVRRGIGTDRRIGTAFLFPGPGYGGSCFPKDVKALIGTARRLGMEPSLLDAVEAVNERQKRLLLERVLKRLGPSLEGRQIAVWGLSFKAETDDMRESPSLPLLSGILEAGGKVRAHDPKAMPVARELFDDRVFYASDPYEAVEGADALVVVTEWLVYRNPDFDRMKQLMRAPLVFDGRNLYTPERMQQLGFEYYGIGRAGRPLPA